jgi:hypothetical protein
MQMLLTTGLLALGLWLAAPAPVQAQATDYTMNRFWYYPFYYFPHSYWPITSPPWPEGPGQPYVKPPAYMSYPAFHEWHWRYDLHERKSYYRGFHFWLDAF